MHLIINALCLLALALMTLGCPGSCTNWFWNSYWYSSMEPVQLRLINSFEGLVSRGGLNLKCAIFL